MAGSSNKINYNVRPAKHVERKMLCEVFRKLSNFDHLSNYTYYGMGSKYYTDFILFHRELNIEKMVNIEADCDNEERYKFNLPFRCIEFMDGYTYEVLPGIDIAHKSIIWLDYDDYFGNKYLEDISTIATKIESGSIFLFSVNTSIPKIEDSEDKTKKTRMCFMKNEFSTLLPKMIFRTVKGELLTEKDLTPNKSYEVIRQMAREKISEVLNQRNCVEKDLDKMKFMELFNVVYEDGAKMYTFGGIFYYEKEKDVIDKCNFEEYGYIGKMKPYKIDVPILTAKEIHFLNQMMPINDVSSIDTNQLNGINRGDVEKYNKIYRFYPHYAEAAIF